MNLAGLDANLLVAVDALLREEHVGRAARRLGLSESAMSHALSRARSLFDDPLLVRVGRRMRMTERARRMAPELREGLARLEAAVGPPPAFDLATVKRPLRIAATDFSHSAVSVALWRELNEKAPQVDMLVSPATGSSFEHLAEGEVDLVISKAVSRLPKGFRSQLLVTERFVSMVRAGHPVLDKRMTAKRFAALDHVVVSPGGRGFGAVDGALAQRKLQRRVAYVSPTFLAAARLVASSDLVLTGSERNAREVADWLNLALFPPGVPLEPFTQLIHWHQRQEHDPFLSWVRGCLLTIVE